MQRTLVYNHRLLGELVEWQGDFGRIRPVRSLFPRSKEPGEVFVAHGDVDEELEGVGAMVSFLVYDDGEKVGAMDVRMARDSELKENLDTCVPQRRRSGGAEYPSPEKVSSTRQPQRSERKRLRDGYGVVADTAKREAEDVLLDRVEGRLAEWSGHSGWIMPTEKIRCSSSASGDGSVYLAHEEVYEELPGVGCLVSFVPCWNGGSLVATSVRKVTRRKFVSTPRGGSQPVLNETHAEPPRQGVRSSHAAANGSSKAALGEFAADAKLQEKVQTVLREAIVSAAEPILHLETDWPEGEVVKRLVRYLHNGCKSACAKDGESPEAVVSHFVNQATSTYTCSCYQKPWFPSLDVAPALIEGSLVLLRALERGVKPNQRVHHAKVERMVRTAISTSTDKMRLEAAFRSACRGEFENQDDLYPKLFTALSRSHPLALEAAWQVESTSGAKKTFRIEAFLKKWITDSMNRAWSMLGDAKGILTEVRVLGLFRRLVEPFGKDDPFSAIPGELLHSFGRPPKEWIFLRKTVDELFASWAPPAATAGSVKRKRRKSFDQRESEGAGHDDQVFEPASAYLGAADAEPAHPSVKIDDDDGDEFDDGIVEVGECQEENMWQCDSLSVEGDTPDWADDFE